MVAINRMRVRSFLLLLLLCSTPLLNAYHHKTITDTVRESGAVALMVGGVIAGACAMYKGLEWLLTPSTQTVIENARESYAYELRRNSEHMNTFSAYVSTTALHEQDLYSISMYYQQLHMPMNNYLHSLHGSMQTLSNHYADLALRLKKLTAREYTYAQPIIVQLMQDIDALVVALDRIYQPLYKHVAYFNLIEHETIMLNKYRNGLLLIPSYHVYNNGALLHEHICSSATYNYYGTTYPYMNYVKAITQDITELSSLLAKLTGYYPSRKHHVQELLDKLTQLKSSAVSSINYAQESHNYEIERREKERLELLRVQVALEEQRNRQLKEMASIQQQQLEVQKKQLEQERCKQQCKQIAQQCEYQCKRACEQACATQQAVNECKRACEQIVAQSQSEYHCDFGFSWN